VGEGGPEASLESYAQALADGIEAALPTWVVSSVEKVMVAWAGEVPAGVAEVAEAVAQRARAEVGPAVRDLLSRDVDEQHTTPLALLRGAVVYPTEILRALGVPAVPRDSFTVAAFPEDDYDLSPASLADIDPALAELGICWGAAKAFEHRHRHRQV
jgi:hypothetical protein